MRAHRWMAISENVGLQSDGFGARGTMLGPVRLVLADWHVEPNREDPMTQSAVPLSVLDLSPVPAGGTAADALRNTIDLAQAAERSGYHRFWVAEHHLAEGVASAAPAVVVALIAGATDRIRVGSGAVQLPNSPPLLVAEQFGTIAALHPDRVDLGLGRFDLHKILSRRAGGGGPSGPPAVPDREVDGLVLPRPSSFPGDAATYEILGRL